MLRRKDEKLADDYETLRKKLANTSRRLAPNSSPLAAPQTEPQTKAVEIRQQGLVDELAAMEKRIREIRALELFQLPPCEEIVRGLAREGPLVAVNVTHLRSDAIIATTEGIKTIELTELELNNLKKKVGIFQQFGSVSRSTVGIEPNAIPVPEENTHREGAHEALRWLWDVAVRPILDDLDADKSVSYSSRRVWWITSGLAGRAPLHAAGNRADGYVENTLSRVASSHVLFIKGPAIRHRKHC